MNTLAYFALSSATKEKRFITLTPGVDEMKSFFSSSMMARQIKLEQCWARSFNDNTLMKRNDKIRFGISNILIRDKKCESQKCIT
jgi:hypothetical protein